MKQNTGILSYAYYFSWVSLQWWGVLIALFWFTKIASVQSAMGFAIMPAAIVTGLKYHSVEQRHMNFRDILILSACSIIFLLVFIALKQAAILGFVYVKNDAESFARTLASFQRAYQVIGNSMPVMIAGLLVRFLLQIALFKFGTLLFYKVSKALRL